jgi:L-malate glycosyltransferase
MLSKILEAGHETFYLRLESPAGCEPPPSPPDGVRALEWGGAVSAPADVTALLPSVPELLALLSEVRPDILHAGPVHTSAFMAALSGFRPMVAMSWAWDILRDAEGSALLRWAAVHALRHCDVLLCDCDTVARRATELSGLPSSRIVCFPWGVDLESFSPAAPHEVGNDSSQERFTVISDRAWSAGYGVETVLEAFRLARRDDPRLFLVLIGEGPLSGWVREFIARQGLQGAVFTPGKVSQEALPQYMRESDVYLSCTPLDGSSVSLLEALACGLPVIVADAPGNREWVQHGEAGWLSRAGDARDFSAALLQAARTPAAQRRAIGGRNRMLAEARADWRRNSEGLLRAYELAASGVTERDRNSPERPRPCGSGSAPEESAS